MVHGSWTEKLSSVSSHGGKLVLYDTTLRDGAQTPGVNMGPEDKLIMGLKIGSFGFHYLEAGWPSTGRDDMELFKKLAAAGLGCKIAAFGMTSPRPSSDPRVKALLDSGAGTITIFGKSWKLHVEKVLRVSGQENTSMIGETIDFLKSHGREVIFDAEHFFDSYKSDPAYAMEILEAAKNADCVVLCDTNGGLMPWEADSICGAVKRGAGNLGIHCHNDSGSAVMNSLTAVSHGFRHVQGTVNGLGERCGNMDWCEFLPTMKFKAGVEPGPDLKGLCGLSLFVQRMTGCGLAANKPYVGGNAFSHKAGVHIDAVNKCSGTYEHVEPESVGNSRSFSLSDQAGRSAVLAVAKAHGMDASKDDEIIREVTAEIKNLRAVTDAEIYTTLAKKSGKEPPFRLVSYVTSLSSAGDAQTSVEVEIKGEVMHEISKGVGPVHSLDMALRKALGRFYRVQDVKLKNYRVRILNQEKATAASVEVFIEFSCGSSAWSTVGVSEDIIKASEQALIKGYEYYLLRPE